MKLDLSFRPKRLDSSKQYFRAGLSADLSAGVVALPRAIMLLQRGWTSYVRASEKILRTKS